MTGALRRTLTIAVLIGLTVATVPASAQRPLLDSARTRLAQLDGTIALAGLDSTVEVRRDKWGVPHIYARTQHDLFFAQGFVAAQDRLWQMEMWRRIGEGRVAEVVGPSAVGRDRIARLLKYRGDMNAEWASYAPDAREIVEAFVQGVNASIETVKGRPPIEFTMVGISPQPWTADVPLQRMAALAMTGNALSEMARAKLLKLIGAPALESIWPTRPYRKLDPATGLNLEGIEPEALDALNDALGPVAYARLEGSNNWVVSGSRTATGKPLLANDPHRAIGLPSLRYLTHLVGPGWNVIGAGEPATPGVAAGHNERIGFGFTIVGMDQQDIYIETVRPCDAAAIARHKLDVADSPRCYFNHGEWRPLRAIIDTILVRGEDPRVVRLEFSEHGPIVAEDSVRQRAFALRFVGSEPGTAGYMASLSLNRATDWTTFTAAAERWKLPTENLIYADVDGNIGWIAAGMMPIRNWSGLLPVPGNGRYEWRGFLGLRDLPQDYNPPTGVIVTANNNILPNGYTRPLNYEWAAPFRAQRITQLLAAGNAFTRADFEKIQHDEFAAPASTLVPLLIAAADRRVYPKRARLEPLARWDYVMRRDDNTPLLFHLWWGKLAHRVFEPRAGRAAAPLVMGEWDPERLIELITAPDTSFGPRPLAARDSVLLLAADDALKQADSLAATNRGVLPIWGSVHRASFRHPLAPVFDLPSVARGGAGYTVNSTAGAGFRQTHGASFREVLDVANWDNSVATSTPGQSGQPGSAHYDDLLPLWRDGRYFPLVYSRARVEGETAHRLMLEPRQQ